MALKWTTIFINSIHIPLSSIASAADFADATTCAAACVTPLDASDKGGKFGLSLAAFTLDATTSCVVLAATSCEHTTSSSYFPSPLTTLSAESLFKKNHNFFVQFVFIKHHVCVVAEENSPKLFSNILNGSCSINHTKFCC